LFKVKKKGLYNMAARERVHHYWNLVPMVQVES